MCAFPTIPTVIQGGGCTPTPQINTLCDVDNCAQCFGVNMCSYCFPGYSLDNDGNCVKNSCNGGSNCNLCDQSGAICFGCNEGYMPDTIFGQNCVEIGENYECTVEDCAVCSGNETCETCMEMFKVNNEGQCE